ncbi:hypothetical protein EV356DRAFT_577170 [Viridothelium virens]|uniref:C3H1-type domain-containing protein n=1 Tax=Viridothelium virens TaxID=1048519 RepID=A0A6A6H817_VIRVR|nr:hypothetical protein EV356DRAFT_577170 [Viridothelium virens]
MKQSRDRLAIKSLSKNKPWDRKKYAVETPPGWEWNSTLNRWNDPPVDWRFSRRGKYWFQIRKCEQYLNGKCLDGKKCRRFHPTSPSATDGSAYPASLHSPAPSSTPPGTPPIGVSPGENVSVPTSSQSEISQAERLVEGLNEHVPEDSSTISTIEAISDLEGFGDSSKQLKKVQWSTNLWQRQGLDLTKLCSRMNMMILQKQPSEVLKAAEIYHNYLKTSGYLSEEALFVRVSASNQCCLDETYHKDSFMWSEIGTVYIKDAGELCSAGRRKVISKLESTPNLVIILGLDTEKLTTSFDNIKSRFTWQLGTLPDATSDSTNQTSGDRVQLALNTILDSVDTEFKGRMQLEGAPEGPVSILARRIVKDCDQSKKTIQEAVHAELLKVYERQSERLMQDAEREGAEELLGKTNVLLISTEDMLGPVPNIESLQSPAWNELLGMVGLEAVKSSIRSFSYSLGYDYYRELDGKKPLQVGLSRLFIGPPGTGKTTVARLYGRILADLGLLSSGELIVKSGADFIGEYIGHSASQAQSILEEARGNVLLIDEAYMLDAKRNHDCPFRQEATDTLIKEVENKPGEDLCVIMCGYQKEMENFIQDTNPVLDIKLSQLDLCTTSEGRKKALELLKLAKQKPNFGNGAAIDNMLSRAIDHHRHRFQKLLKDQRHTDIPLTVHDFDPEYSNVLNAEEEVVHQFKDFVGFEACVDIFKRFAQQVKNARQLWKNNSSQEDWQSILSYGPSLTDEVLEASVSDMISEYLGRTAKKTRKLLKSALGKVLFIDEAYRLAEDKDGNAYTKEARDELVDAMTKPRFLGKMIIILAGYESMMDKMLDTNPGLASRFEGIISFKNLSIEGCTTLLRVKIEALGVKAAFGEDEEMIMDIFDILRTMKDWGNGRDVESIARRAIGKVFESPIDGGPPTIDGSIVLDAIREWSNQRYPLVPLPHGRRVVEEPVQAELHAVDVEPQRYSDKAASSSNVSVHGQLNSAEPEFTTDASVKEATSEGGSKGCDLSNGGSPERSNFLAPKPGEDSIFLEYLPLPNSKSIRLIELAPGSGYEDIVCTLKPIALENAKNKAYDALSYVWGDSTQRTPIMCDGRRLDITLNLKIALRQLRLARSARMLWIDAISINQDNLKEREDQVTLMKIIYAHANCTIVWLGEAYEGSDIAFSLCDRLAPIALQRLEAISKKLGMKSWEELDPFLAERVSKLEDSSAIALIDHEIGYTKAMHPSMDEVFALNRLIQRPWFVRAWVVQDIGVSNHAVIMCGERFTSLGMILCACIFCCIDCSKPTHQQRIPRLIELQFKLKTVESDYQEVPILLLLLIFRPYMATDPRDKAFAFYGITTSSLEKLHFDVVTNN